MLRQWLAQSGAQVVEAWAKLGLPMPEGHEHPSSAPGSEAQKLPPNGVVVPLGK